MAKVVDVDDRVTEALLFALNNPTVESDYFCMVQVLGGAMAIGAVENDTRAHYTFVNPELRSAIASVTCFLDYPDNGVDDAYYISHALDFEELFAPFSEGKDRYYGEEDVAAWKKQFHGDMYGSLIDAKLKYDIDNFFWCHQCVGSDFRIDCRYNDRHRGLLLSGYVNSLRASRVFRANRRMDPRDKRIRQPFMRVMMIQGE